MKIRKKVLFFPFDLLAHYLRCLVLADQYNKDEFEVYFLHSDAYSTFIEAHGYQTFSAITFNSADVMACAAKFDFSWLDAQSIESVFHSQVSAIEKLKPELVIGDVAPTLKMAAEFCKVRYIALMNGYMSPYYARGRKISKSHPAHHILNRMPASIAVRVTEYGEKLSFWKIHMPFKRLRKKYRLSSVSSYLWETQGDENLICDLPYLFPQHLLPANYKIIGPLIYQKHTSKTHNLLSRLDDSKPTICVCLGSTGNWENLKFLDERYFSRFNIIAAGDMNGVLSAPHVISSSFVNLPEVLSRTDLLICHGGNGTINCGIQANVYMLCLTAHFEQEWNVDAIEKLGLCKSADGFSFADWQMEINLALSRSVNLVS